VSQQNISIPCSVSTSPLSNLYKTLLNEVTTTLYLQEPAREMELTQELIHRCKNKERSAMAELFRILAPKIKGVCYRYTGNAFDAEDLLQETFIIVFTKIDSFKEEGSFEGWARRIAVNNCINWLKKNKVTLQMQELNNKNEMVEEEEEENLEEVHGNELMQNIAQLPEGYRTILNLFAIEGFSHKEIASQLGISESTSRSQYTRAKKALQQLFTKEKRS
jgi:RNA polymerase sigma-70 factor (ECF subfamily)